MRYLYLTLCLAVAAACGSDPVGPSPHMEGPYHLVSIDGVAPPERVDDMDGYGTTVVTAATLTFYPSSDPAREGYDATWRDSLVVAFPTSTFPSEAILLDWGRAYLSGMNISMFSMMSLNSDEGRVSLTDVSIVKDGRRWVYRK